MFREQRNGGGRRGNSWYGRRESNPRLELGRLSRCHYATPAYRFAFHSIGPLQIRQVVYTANFCDGSQGRGTWASECAAPHPSDYNRSVCRPRCKILIAAFLSRSIISPQAGQVWMRVESDFSTNLPHWEHILEVSWGFTRMTDRPASSALPIVISMN